jgi:hypothetical protein
MVCDISTLYIDVFVCSTECALCCAIHFRKAHGAKHLFDSFEIGGDRVADKSNEGLAAHSIVL